jgi:hypothetical protein
MNREAITRDKRPPPPYKPKRKKIKIPADSQVTAELNHRITRAGAQFTRLLAVAHAPSSSLASPIIRERPCRPLPQRDARDYQKNKDQEEGNDEERIIRRQDRRRARDELRTIRIVAAGTEALAKGGWLLTLHQRRFLNALRKLLERSPAIVLCRKNICVVLFQTFSIRTLLEEEEGAQDSLAAMMKCVGLKLTDLHNFVYIFSGGG